MNALIVPVLLDEPPAKLCGRKYHGHRHGCPNLGKKRGCPPGTWHMRDFGSSALAERLFVWTEFDLGMHAERMLELHPNWSDRQARCCLYWQAGARKRLRAEVRRSIRVPYHRAWVIYAPEAHGVNVTATLAKVGVELEWPPRQITRQVAMVLSK